MMDKDLDAFLSERLTRALAHTMTEFCRANREISSRAVVAAAVGILVTAARTARAEPDKVAKAVLATWDKISTRAQPSPAGSDASPPSQTSPPPRTSQQPPQ